MKKYSTVVRLSRGLEHDFAQALRAFVRHGEAKALTPDTLDWYSRRLQRFVTFAEAEGLTPATTETRHLRAYLDTLTCGSVTRNGHARLSARAVRLASLRGLSAREPSLSTGKVSRGI